MAHAHAASFSSLPSDVVGQIYSLLPDAGSKRAFSSSCSSVRHAASATMSRLTISHKQLRSTTVVPPVTGGNPLSCVPHGVKLRTLVIVGRDSSPQSRGKGGFSTDEGHALLQLLQPARENIKGKVWEAIQSLQEVQLKGLIYFSNASAAGLGTCLGSLPNLSTIRILRPDGPAQLGYVSQSQVPASFFASLSSAPFPSTQLTVLDISAQPLLSENLLAISHLTGLQALTFAALDHADLSSLASLKRLSSLTLLWRTVDDEHENFDWLAELDHLRILNVRAWPSPSLMFEKLPTSLQTLIFEDTEHASFILWALADTIRPDRLPSLRCIVIKELEFDEEDCESLGSTLSAFLSANPQLTIRCGWLEASENMDGFITCCARAPAFARGIEEVSLGNGNYLDDAIRLLADVGASPKCLTLADCAIEDLRRVHEGLKRLPGLSKLDIWYMSLPPPGFGAAVLSLCVRASLVLHVPACEVAVDWTSNSLDEFTTSLSGPDTPSGSGGVAIRDRKREMATLRGLWELTSQALPTTTRVKLRTRVGIQDL